MSEPRICRCGFSGLVDENECPDCGAEWFVPVSDNWGISE